ncbi:methyl-accepting chemotaxis protein [Effusibacillus dendaii]|uniref:Methyl-accepting chemotaxis protein n=1 Tax=Effusibacillus dendaii TaxID=2743772 RepID=A0A7I8D9T8_9BACL|nr:methyl-accepting chemotaxis protein [Effusibacillus dendaii]BCJ86884.1 methyl-accepting chemotaxis protein [Effusibacillus dendaii]
MNTEYQSPKFSLVKKIVLGIVALAFVTYVTSAFFIFVLKDWIAPSVPDWLYVSGTLLLGIIWSGILGYFAAKWITKPLISLEGAARLAARGDLRHTIQVSSSDDELRSLGIAFNSMLDSLRKMVSNVDLNFKQTHDYVNELSGASEHAAKNVEMIALTMEEIATGAEKQFELTDKTAELTQQAGRLSEQVSDQVRQSKVLCADLENTLNQGAQIIGDLVKGLQNVAQFNRESTELVVRLENNAKEIGNIIGVVGDISVQTNLLALNASIEAARAGEHGRGFTVVAEEVRKLSDQTGEAVEQIGLLIRSMQNEVQEVVARISQQNHLVADEAAKGEETTGAIREMTNSVHQVVDSVDQIDRLMNQQVRALQSVMEEAKHVSSIARKTATGSQSVLASVQEQTAFLEETASSANVLRQSASDLERILTSFEI